MSGPKYASRAWSAIGDPLLWLHIPFFAILSYKEKIKVLKRTKIEKNYPF